MSNLPSGWAWATLEDLIAAEDRAITDGPFGSNLKSSDYTSSGARVIRLQNIGDGAFIDEHAYVDLRHFEKLRAHAVREGDLVVASLGAQLPRACIIPSLGSPAIVKADCIRVRLHPDIDGRWVLYALIAPQTKRYAATRVRGVGRPRLGLNEIRRIPIPVPPLGEQRRIVAALEDLLSRLEVGNRSLHEARSRLVPFRQAIRGHGVVGALTSGITGKDLPPGWRWGTLRDVVTAIEAGKSFACEPRPATPDEWGVIKVSAMTWGEFREGENKAVPAHIVIDPRHEIRPGDILVSRANTESYVGAPVLVRHCRNHLLLSDKSLRLKPQPSIDREWLLQILSSPDTRRQISAKATGTKDSMRNISQSRLLEIEIPIPPSEAQPAVASEIRLNLERVERLDEQLRRSQERIVAFRRSLLGGAFGGRLVARDPNDEPAPALLARLREARTPRGLSSRGGRTMTDPIRTIQKDTLW